jgi:predicted permease
MPAMETLLQDLRYGLKVLTKSPGFTAVGVLALALGIGASTALFSVLNGVVLNPLPYEQPNRLVALHSIRGFRTAGISYPNFLDWARDNHTLSTLGAFRSDDFDLTGISVPERIAVAMVSADFFSTLGVKPILGRSFSPSEEQVGAAPVAMISYGFWKRELGGSRYAIGKKLELNAEIYTVVGVIPAGFRYEGGDFRRGTMVFVPIGQWNNPAFRDRRAGTGMGVIGRLKPRMTLAQAKADMNIIARRLAEAYPEADKGEGIALIPLKQEIVGDVQSVLLVLLAAVGFLLLIACANVANLLLARSTARTHEFAIRFALGASQMRIVRQLLVESVLLAVASGALGLLLAAWGTQAAIRMLPEALPRAEDIGLDERVLIFTFAVSVLTGILFGLCPALKSAQPNLTESLNEGGRRSTGARHRTQRILIVAEMAMAVVLLIGAGLMIRSLTKLWSINPGFDPDHVVTFNVSSPASIRTTPEAARATLRQIRDIVASVPGVEGASLNWGAIPMVGDSEVPFWLASQPKPSSESEMRVALFYAVQPDYLKIMKIPLLRGRFLGPQDNEQSPRVIVIDRQFARLAFGNQDPVGKRVSFGILGASPEIIGVVGHVNQWGLDRDSTNPLQAQFYFPISQTPNRFLSSIWSGGGTFFVRTAGPPLAPVSAIRLALRRYNSRLVMFGIQRMDDIISNSLARRRFVMVLLGLFALLALGLSTMGVYGVISYITSQRTHEIGIRMALGAQLRDVVGLVVSQGMKLALAGAGIGLVAAFGLTTLMTKMIYGISSHDPVTFFSAAFLISLIALVACYVPARWATRVDPTVALRNE